MPIKGMLQEEKKAAPEEAVVKKAEVGLTPKETKIADLKRKLLDFKAKVQDPKVRGVEINLDKKRFPNNPAREG